MDSIFFLRNGDKFTILLGMQLFKNIGALG